MEKSTTTVTDVKNSKQKDSKLAKREIMSESGDIYLH